ncbi:hypothetical protein ACGGZK_08305 [Agromyces sp. MMS24-K17]|uniref:hypothetical protein n=1 Tax=Agromyces sp. MMS24-K17 TaxID=3372850 RepID=UPI0037548810
MHRGARRRAAVAVAVALLGLTGCSAAAPAPSPPAGVDLEGFDPASGNGLWLLSGDAIADAVLDAARDAGSAHVTGSVTELVQPEDPQEDPFRGRTLSLDYTGRAERFTATVGGGDVSARIAASDGVARVLGNGAYAASLGAPELADTVVCSVGTEQVLERWSPLLSPVDLVRTLVEGDGGTVLSVAEPADGDAGDTLDVVVGTDDTPLGVLTVERFGPPLPRSFTASDASGGGSFAFADWGATADQGAIDALACPAR